MKEVFPIEPASSTALWVVGGVFATLIPILVLFGYLAWSARNVRVEVSEAEIRVRGSLYGRSIAANSIDPNSLQRVDLSGQSPHALRTRSNGVGMPGFKAGWFRLQNGEKALVFVSDTDRAVYFKTPDFAVVLTPSDPDAFLASLRKKTTAN